MRDAHGVRPVFRADLQFPIDGLVSIPPPYPPFCSQDWRRRFFVLKGSWLFFAKTPNEAPAA